MLSLTGHSWSLRPRAWLCGMLPPRRSEEIRGGLAVSPPHSIHQPLLHCTVPFPWLVGSRGLHSGSGRVGSRGLFSGSGRVGSGPAESIHRSRWPPLFVHFLAPPMCHVHFSTWIRSISSPATYGKEAISIISLFTFWPDFFLILLCVCTTVTYKISQHWCSLRRRRARGWDELLRNPSLLFHLFCSSTLPRCSFTEVATTVFVTNTFVSTCSLGKLFICNANVCEEFSFAWEIIYLQRKCV